MNGLLRALDRHDGETVLLGPRKAVALGAGLAEHAHHLLVVRALQAVGEHVVQHLAVPHAHSTARLRQQIGRIGHRFHAAGDHDFGRSHPDRVAAEHDRLQAGAADLVDGHAADRHGHTRPDRGLARRSLALAGGEHAPHDHFARLGRVDARFGDGAGDGCRAEVDGAAGGELSLERTDGRALRAHDDDTAI